MVPGPLSGHMILNSGHVKNIFLSPMVCNKYKRKFLSSYIEFGFIREVNNSVDLPKCIICFNVLSNESCRQSKPRHHLETKHPFLKSKDKLFFLNLLDGLKNNNLVTNGITSSTAPGIAKASYIVAFHIARLKKPHIIAENLIFPCMIVISNSIFSEKETQKIKSIPHSNSTISRRISCISKSFLNTILDEIRSSIYFAIQCDETTDVANPSQLIVFIRYVYRCELNQEMLFCRPLETTTKAIDNFLWKIS